MSNRCDWAGQHDEAMIRYHDKEWGVPEHDDRKLFEFLVLEGAQAGLSWSTILKRRQGYRNAFAQFDPEKVARFTKKDIAKLLNDPGIIRNKLKVRSAIENAKQFLTVQKEFGSFNAYIWSFVHNKPIKNKWKIVQEIPASTKISDVISRALKKRGFSFVGSTIMYAHMQATGMVNDHLTSCFRYNEV